MGNETSQHESFVDDEAARARHHQLQELQDISSNYLDHLELIVDSRSQMEDPRDVIMVLKANLKTAREEIEKISTKRIINIQHQNYTNNNNNNDSPLPNGNKKTHTSSNDSPLSKSQRLLLQPTDSDSIGSSYISKFQSNNRFVYDWCNASIEQIYFDQCNLGKINSIEIATSTYDPVIMATVSQDGKCRIWKLRQKSKYYEIIKHTNRKTNQIPLFTDDFNNEIKKENSTEYIENTNDKKRNSKKSKNKKDRKRSSNKSRKNSHKTSIDSDVPKIDNFGDIDIYSSLGSDNTHITNNGKIPRKELRFELCHEIKLSSTWNMCCSIHHKGNLVAIGGLDTNVTIFDITTLNINDKNNNNNHGFPDVGSKPSSPRPKHKKQKSVSIFSSKKRRSIDKEMDRIVKSAGNTPIIATTPITEFEIFDKSILLCELPFWDEYISCIKFMNDKYHIIIGSGDGTVTICNYITMDKINSWKCKYDVISVDYLYLQNNININRDKSKSILSIDSNISNSLVVKKDDKNNKKKKKKGWKFGRKSQKDKNKVYIDDELADSDSDNNMSSNALHQMYDPENTRQIMILIGTSNANTDKKDENNIFIDEYNLIINDENNDKTMDIQTIKKIHSVQYKQKIIAANGINMKKSFCLDNKKCECVKFSPNGKYFAVGGESGKYEIYITNRKELIHERYTKDENDKIVLQRRPNLKKEVLTALNEDDNDIDDSAGIICITWINNNSVAIGNIKGEFIYISTILHEYKIRNFILKEYINIINNNQNNFNNIIDEINEFIGIEVIDNVIEVNFGQRTSCLTSHPYFEMKPSNNNMYNMYNNNLYNKKEGLCVSGSWSKVFQGCVLKG